MQNRKLFHLILALLVCYLVSQTILYVLSQRRSVPVSRQHDVESQSKRQQKSKAYMDPFRNMRDYLDLTINEGIPIILLDPDVLKKVINPSPADNQLNCTFFCDGHDMTLIGVNYQMWTNSNAFLTKLHAHGFEVAYFTETGPDSLHYLPARDQSEIRTHYLIHRGQHTIHQVVIYSMPAGYSWIGGFNWTNINGEADLKINDWLGGKQERLFFEQHSRVFNSLEVIKVTMDGLRLRAPRYPNGYLDDLPHATFLPCNRSRARLFSALYGETIEDGDDPETVVEFRDANREILTQAKVALDGLGVRFWLSSGTCLGWYRQCDPIHYSGDVDIGIWITDYDRRLIPAMVKNGLFLRHIFGKESDSYEISFVNEDIKLDIFFFYEEGDTMWNGGTRAKTGQKYKYIFPKFTLCWTEFLGLLVRVPCDTERYLEANYGQRWFEPVREWDWKSSPSNVIENGHWPQSEWDKVIQTFD